MPKRKVFFSFHFDNDVFRVQLVRNIGALEGNQPVTKNAWEEVKRGGDAAIQKWIADTMKDKSCCVVLVGEETANRKWVKYEIEKAWNDNKGVVGIYIHNLKCPNNGTCRQGANPFDSFTMTKDKKTKLSSIVDCHNPKAGDAYNDIAANLDFWVESAIAIRQNYK